MNIRYLERDEIDELKWNSCIHYAGNGNIFGYTWYLDNVAREWGGLVEDDYTSVFPLPFRDTFLNRRQLFQPSLMRENGLYTVNALSEARMRAFIEAIPDHYVIGNISLNEQNHVLKRIDNQVQEKENHQLLLVGSYEELVEDFSRKRLEELDAAEKAGLRVIANKKPEVIADFFKAHSKTNNTDKNYHALMRIMYNCMHRGWGVSSVTTDANENILAANYYIYSQGKVLSLCPAESAEGAQKNALAYNLNMLIKSHSKNQLVLDFNGADFVKNLAEGFGGIVNNYYSWSLQPRDWKAKLLKA